MKIATEDVSLILLMLSSEGIFILCLTDIPTDDEIAEGSLDPLVTMPLNSVSLSRQNVVGQHNAIFSSIIMMPNIWCVRRSARACSCQNLFASS